MIDKIIQRAVFGPELFLLYVDDLHTLLSSVLSYNGDIWIRISIESEVSSTEIEDNLEKLSKLSRTWKFSINASKCIVIHIIQIHSDHRVTSRQDLRITTYYHEMVTKDFRALWSMSGASIHVHIQTYLTLSAVFVSAKLD